MKTFREYFLNEVNELGEAESIQTLAQTIDSKKLYNDILEYTKSHGAYENKKWFSAFAKSNWRSSHYNSLSRLRDPSIGEYEQRSISFNKSYGIGTLWKINIDFGNDNLWVEAQITFPQRSGSFPKFSYDGEGSPKYYIEIKDKELIKRIYAFYATYKYLSDETREKFYKLYTEVND